MNRKRCRRRIKEEEQKRRETKEEGKEVEEEEEDEIASDEATLWHAFSSGRPDAFKGPR